MKGYCRAFALGAFFAALTFGLASLTQAQERTVDGQNATGVPALDFVPPAPETLVAQFPTQAPSNTRFEIRAFPSVSHYGDPFYVEVIQTNVSQETIEVSALGASGILPNLQFFASSPTLTSGEYRWVFEILPTQSRNTCADVQDCLSLDNVQRKLQPGESCVVARARLESAPLEDWDAPFWSDLRFRLLSASPSPILPLETRCYWKNTDGSSYETHFTIQLIKRENDELKTLGDWRRETPAKFFPVPVAGLYSYRELVSFKGIEAPNAARHLLLANKYEENANIEIDGRLYSPWAFAPIGSRKPFAPNAPATLDGWRALETQFSPSTLRDEIMLTRLLIEYYAASTGDETDASLQRIADRLAELPETQRNVLIAYATERRKECRYSVESGEGTYCDKQRRLRGRLASLSRVAPSTETR